ncbi:hypothetical protein BMETH_37211167886, partial [methanotrophic bacterial endosymbiont of Bathymodiolus sp.]
ETAEMALIEGVMGLFDGRSGVGSGCFSCPAGYDPLARCKDRKARIIDCVLACLV